MINMIIYIKIIFNNIPPRILQMASGNSKNVAEY